MIEPMHTAPIIAGAGTQEATWQRWPMLHRLDTFNLARRVDHASRIVIVAPHPDDEVLGCGGLLGMLAANTAVQVIAVTDGEASHTHLTAAGRARLRQQRHAESDAGLMQLKIAASARVRLAIPDGQVKQHQQMLSTRLKQLIAPGDHVFTTWLHDGHPDHEAVANTTVALCAELGSACYMFPIWMWHWAQPDDRRVPWAALQRLPLSAAAVQNKARAIAEHQSQLTRVDGTPPILSEQTLRRLLRDHEYFFAAQ